MDKQFVDKQFSVCASLGRIHDPLAQLAQRVHRALLIREKTVWMGASGFIFATHADQLREIPPHTVIGLYAKWTPVQVIEMGLRYALRERASAWMVDWKAGYSLNPQRINNNVLQFTAPRKRRRKAMVAETLATTLPGVGLSSHAQPQP